MLTPTNIQYACIPTALMGKDICACAVTGSGKTLGLFFNLIFISRIEEYIKLFN
jgi:superfamily II DNA/RNA helicase